VALIARELAVMRHVPHPDELYAAGLLHDIGVICEDQYLHDKFEEVIEAPDLRRQGLSVIERRTMGFDHAQLAEQVALMWRLPDLMVESVAAHHDLRRAVHHKREAAFVAFANLLAELPDDDRLEHAAMRMTGFDLKQETPVKQHIKEHLARAEGFFK
jgi:HD-like signal output (HDOD) protein